MRLISSERAQLLPALPMLALALLMIAWAPGAQADKYYRIIQVDIEAHLRDGGNMVVRESRTYDFHGSYRHAHRVIPTGGAETYQDIRVSEGGRDYRLSDSREPGTFEITRERNQIKVEWFFRASHESRTFDLHYQVSDLVQRHDDAAVLYFKFIGEGWRKPSRDVRVCLNPPSPLARDQVRAWLHGPLWANLAIEEGGSIIARCEHLPKKTYLEIRALYPPELFPRVGPRPGTVRAHVMEEEALWAEQANRLREEAAEKAIARKTRWALGKGVMPIVALIGLLAWVSLFRKYGQRPRVRESAGMASGIPTDTPPAVVGYLLHARQVCAGDLVATLMDLARRGFVVMREEEREKRGLLGGRKKVTEYFWDLKRDHYRENAGDLLKYEDELIRFIFDELAGGEDSIALKTIRKKRSKFTKFFKRWSREVKTLAREKGYFDEQSLHGMKCSVLVGIAMLVLAIPAALLFGPWALILAGAGVLVLGLSFVIPHRTPEGEIEARQWKSLKGYLGKRHLEALGPGLLTRIDSYLVYAIVLGLSRKAFRELAACIPPDAAQTYVPWFACHGAGAGTFSPGAFATAFSTMIASATSTASAASGAGGGASTGGGGGAGGGGGGAG